MFLFSSKPDFAIVFHIGSASVGAGLLRLECGKGPHVMYSLRELIPYRDSVAPERFIADMLGALKKVNARISSEALQAVGHKFKAKHVYYVLSSPWTVTQAKVASIREQKPFVLTKARVDHIVDSQTKAAEGLQLFEKRVVDVKLNGYQIADPYGKKARSADISLFMGFVPKTILNGVIDSAARTYHPKDTRLASFALASYLAARDIFHDQSDFIFLDIGGELSDVSVVRDGAVVETASFPLGRNSIIRKLQVDLGISAEEVISLVRTYEEGVADESLAAGLRPVLDAATTAWMSGFREALDRIASGKTLPRQAYLVVNDDFARFFERILGVDSVTMSPKVVDSATLCSAVSFADKAVKDPFIAMAAFMAGKLYESGKR